MPTYLDILPVEVVDYIWSINYTWASNIIKHCWQKSIKNQVNEIQKMMQFAAYNARLGFYIKQYHLCYKNRVLNNLDILHITGACKCCARHQKDKPTTLAKWNGAVPDTNGSNNPCDCPCRHIARFVCRGVE